MNIFINVPGMGIRPDFKTKRVFYQCEINQDNIDTYNMPKERGPKFRIELFINNLNCDINQPFNGTVKIIGCSIPIKSIELQFLRKELKKQGGEKEESEVQNLQIGDGDVNRDIDIPLFMLFPRNYCCSNQEDEDFKVSFEIKLHVVLINAIVISYGMPLNLWRSS